MKCIGVFNSQNIPISDDEYGQLLEYANGCREIRIYYKRKEPYFQVAYVAILTERTETYETFEVFEYEYFNTTENHIKSYIKGLVEKADEFDKLKEQPNQ